VIQFQRDLHLRLDLGWAWEALMHLEPKIGAAYRHVNATDVDVGLLVLSQLISLQSVALVLGGSRHGDGSSSRRAGGVELVIALGVDHLIQGHCVAVVAFAFMIFMFGIAFGNR
jgi:hypothetical protein